MTVEQLLANTDARELAEWQAVFRLRERERKDAERQRAMKQSAADQADEARRGMRGHR